jgi:para-nitrobenzyl esterase
MPAEDLVDEMYVHHHMTVDGYVLEETPYESYMKGIHNEEAQLHGFNRDESGPFILFSQADSKNYEGRIDRYFGEYADEVKALYPGKTDEQAKKDWADIYTAVYFTYGHYCWQRLAQLNGIPSYVYYFTKSNGRLGTWHAGEEIYFYHNIKEDSKQFTDEDRALSDMMSQYFLNFIKTGDPNGGDLPEWTAYSGKDEVFEFGEQTGPVETPMTGLYEIFDRFYGF